MGFLDNIPKEVWFQYARELEYVEYIELKGTVKDTKRIPKSIPNIYANISKAAELSNELVCVGHLPIFVPRVTIQAFSSNASKPRSSNHGIQARCIDSLLYRALEASNIQQYLL